MAGERADDATHCIAIYRRARERAVEVDDVEMGRAGLCKGERLRRWIIAVNGRARHVAFGQSHDLTRLEVDRGEDDQGRHARNLSSSASP